LSFSAINFSRGDDADFPTPEFLKKVDAHFRAPLLQGKRPAGRQSALMHPACHIQIFYQFVFFAGNHVFVGVKEVVVRITVVKPDEKGRVFRKYQMGLERSQITRRF
jgi:hypothetical protein